MKLSAIAILVVSTLTGVIGQLFLKKGTLVQDNIPIELDNLLNMLYNYITNVYIVSWIFFAGISAFLWIIVVSKFELSFAYPVVMSSSFVLVVLFSSLLFGENISISRWAGIAVLCSGIFLVST